MNMDINKLKAFVTVVEQQSFTRAAAELYISQPALSKKISDFEREIGTALLVRDNRSMELTPAGKLLYGEAPAFLKVADALETKVREKGQNPGSQLSVGCSGIEYGRLHRIMARFRAEHPGVSVAMHRFSAAEIQQRILTNMLDVAFQTSFEVKREPEVEHVPFSRDELAVIMSHSHPLAGEKVVTMEQLKDEVYFGIQPQQDHMPFSHMINRLCELNYAPKEIRIASSVEELLLNVSCGLGIAHLFARTEEANHSLVHYARCETPSMELEIDLVWNRSNDNPAIGWFADLVRQENAQQELF